jgi:hypothetical protein
MLWTQLEVAVAGPEHQTTSIIFIFGIWSTNKMLFFVVLACACSFVTEDGVTSSARRLDLVLVQKLLHSWHAVRVSRQLFYFYFFAQVVVVHALGCTD